MNSNKHFNKPQNILASTLDDIRDSLKQIKKEYQEVLANSNADIIEEFLKQSLLFFHEDIVTAKRTRSVPTDQLEVFKNKYSKIATAPQNLKKEIKSKDEQNKGKRTLGRLCKFTLPELKDSLDGGPWQHQVEFMIDALHTQEDNNPIIRQKVIEMIKESTKNATGQLKIMAKSLESWNDLDSITEKIFSHLANQFNLLDDLTTRLKNMKLPKTRFQMTNCQEVILNLDFLISKDMIKHISPSLFVLLTEKTLHHQDHRPKFEVHLNAIFQNDDEK